MKNIILQLVASFFGAMGFSFVFNTEKKHTLPCSFGGVLTWAVYLLARDALGLDDLISSVMGGAACQIFAEILARLMKAPSTAFCIPALVPLIPGGGLYRTMDAFISKDWENFRSWGADTLQITFGIAIGISLVSAVLYIAGVGKDKAKKEKSQKI